MKNRDNMFLTMREDSKLESYSIDLRNEEDRTQSQGRYFYRLNSTGVTKTADAKEGTLVITKNNISTRNMTGRSVLTLSR